MEMYEDMNLYKHSCINFIAPYGIGTTWRNRKKKKNRRVKKFDRLKFSNTLHIVIYFILSFSQ